MIVSNYEGLGGFVRIMSNSMEKKILFLLFFASGISGLIYEVIWLRMLSRVLGVTTYATAITLAAFMAGLGIGSYILGKITDNSKKLLKIYVFLQLLISLSAVITPLLFSISIPLYKGIYEISNNSRLIVTVMRILISFFTLLIPTTLMGGTLPLLTGYLTKKDKMFGANLSLLYGLNTLGAVVGVLLSGFITIGTLGEWETIFIGVVINLIVAEGILIIDKKKTGSTEEKQITVADETAGNGLISLYPDNTRKFVLISILISGFTALAYEVIWTRQLILYLNVSIYAFSAMLAVFLMGVASGSLFINRFINKLKTPLFIFGILEVAVGVLSVINLYIFPFFDIGEIARIISPVALVFPITFIFGMIFPIASICFAKSVNKTGSSIGTVYIFNTAGNMAGSLITGFILISLIGSTKTIILLAMLNVLVGFLLLYIEPGKRINLKLKYALILPVIILLMLGTVRKDIFLDVIKKWVSAQSKNYKIFYNKECVQGTVTSCMINGSKHLLINGTSQTKLCTETKLMAHLPVILTDTPKKFLAICFGMGTIVESASIYDNMDITSVELVPEVYQCFKYYHNNSDEILKNKNIKLIAEDGRNYLLLSSDKYDVISVDPSPPIYSAGTVNLYAKDFFEICKKHLTHGGVMCMWFIGGEKGENWMILNTFFSVFPNMSVWRGPHNWGFYLVGSLKNIRIDIKKFKKFFKNKKLIEDLKEYDNSCITSDQLLKLLFYSMDGLKESMRKYPIISDNNPYTEFPLFR